MVENRIDKPRVSVVCITYGQEDYIAQALDSFLMQKTTFRYQILVGEDKGPDRTAEIVLEYAEKYPDIIIPYIREDNMGAQRNLIDLCRRAGTEYIAFCEGDDYWCDEYKLQKQFDFMEEHPEYRACFHNTRIMTDTSWYLYNWYIHDKEGSIYIPESIPNYDRDLREMRMDYYIKFGPAHTSSLFYRWDNNRDIPEWYYRHIYGDHSLVMIQVGDGLIGYIPETMSVYRRSEVGVLMYESKTDHFLKSRESWIEMAMDLESYFKKYYNDFANKEIQERIVQEFSNYIRFLVSSGNEQRLKDAYEKYTYAASLSITQNAINKRKIEGLKRLYSEDGIRWLLSDKNTIKQVKKTIDERSKKVKERQMERIRAYIENSRIKKDPTLWAFSQEDRYYFGGNVRHLFEFILAYHPEIHPVWLTRNQNLIKLFVSEGIPYAKIGSRECLRVMETASVAVMDQFRTKAFAFKGYNSGMKVVRLGLGATIEDFSRQLFSASAPQLAPTATAEEIVNNNLEKYAGISVDDSNRGYFLENYRDTFLQVAPSQEAARIYTETYGVKTENVFICGSPRSFAVGDNIGETRKKILMVPGKRSSVIAQEDFFNEFVEKLGWINSKLEELDSFLDVFFSNEFPRGYYRKFTSRADVFPRINVIGGGRDIYHDFSKYDVLITDWAKEMFDYIMLDRPVVVFCPNKDEYLTKMSLLYDYDDVIPGESTNDWEQLFKMVEKRLVDPSIDYERREHAKNMVFDMSVNDKDNSERIIQEIKRRLGNDD